MIDTLMMNRNILKQYMFLQLEVLVFLQLKRLKSLIIVFIMYEKKLFLKVHQINLKHTHIREKLFT